MFMGTGPFHAVDPAIPSAAAANRSPTAVLFRMCTGLHGDSASYKSMRLAIPTFVRAGRPSGWPQGGTPPKKVAAAAPHCAYLLPTRWSVPKAALVSLKSPDKRRSTIKRHELRVELGDRGKGGETT